MSKETRYLTLWDMCHVGLFAGISQRAKGTASSAQRAFNSITKAGYDLPKLEELLSQSNWEDDYHSAFRSELTAIKGVTVWVASSIRLGILANQKWKENESKVTEDLDSLPSAHYWEYFSGYDTPCKFTLEELNEGYEVYTSRYGGRHSKRLYKYTMMSFLDHTLSNYMGHGDIREDHEGRGESWECWYIECLTTRNEEYAYWETINSFGEYT